MLPSDLDSLYRMATQADALFSWRLRGQTINPAEFAGAIHAGVHLQLIMCHRADPGRCLGVLQLFNYDASCGIAYLSALIERDATAGSSCLVECLEAFLDYSFATLPLFKVYFETSEAVFASVPSLAGYTALWNLEGVLKDHYVLDGERLDLLVGSLYSEAWRSRSVLTGDSRTPSFDQFIAAIPDALKESCDWPDSPSGGHRFQSDLGVDSLWMLELVIWAEEFFGRKIRGEDLNTFQALYADLTS